MLVAADNSCLTHIGGILGRERAGMRTLHLAEVLASTERDAETAHAEQPAESAQWQGLPEQEMSPVSELASSPSSAGAPRTRPTSASEEDS